MVGVEMVMGLPAALTITRELKMLLVWFGSAFHFRYIIWLETNETM